MLPAVLQSSINIISKSNVDGVLFNILKSNYKNYWRKFLEIALINRSSICRLPCNSSQQR